MNNLKQFLYENPAISEQFIEINKDIISEIKQRFCDFHESKDLISRFLFVQALFEIIEVESRQSQELIKLEIQRRAELNFSNEPGEC